MEATIAQFEPRLKRAKVRMEPIDGNYRSLRFVIDGMLCMDPSPEPVSFDTVIGLKSGNCKVSGGPNAG